MIDGKCAILAIESSCDETAAAVVLNGRQVLSNVISSQIDIHKQFGGVVPEIASRHHLDNINHVVQQALDEAGESRGGSVSMGDIDAIAVTYGPGLVGALLIGLATAKAFALATGKPLIGVHHIHGHICANYIEHEDLEPPFYRHLPSVIKAREMYALTVGLCGTNVHFCIAYSPEIAAA